MNELVAVSVVAAVCGVTSINKTTRIYRSTRMFNSVFYFLHHSTTGPHRPFPESMWRNRKPIFGVSCKQLYKVKLYSRLFDFSMYLRILSRACIIAASSYGVLREREMVTKDEAPNFFHSLVQTATSTTNNNKIQNHISLKVHKIIKYRYRYIDIIL